ncbi:TonB-dependent receptor [Agriterribacter sp.]|uniref:SusC/RagA family TonB-linked outer membrane protein n=1 Tax=Agriterribacter sp. TaxID=2821509 RepID=UPI002B8EA77D|nr:TonB-dependent receptor [Agriterribacter sp.]HRO46683.1 TonB-dependent receptor [Agriterribacter sp.]HRQ16977.1 TonB-dependent receptor [Agriterribacter sp.]
MSFLFRVCIKKIWLFTGLFLCFSVLQAQNHIVEGYIIDSKTNEPVISAVISEKGTDNKVLSDTKGFFSLQSVKAFPVTLVITSVGYKPGEEALRSVNNPVTISLSQHINELNEVVVVGYGTQRRKDLTGAVTSVSKKILEYNVSPTIDGLLGGAVAGLNVTQGSGQPGAPSTIRIRGGNSVNASNNPLFVIDGFLYFSDNASTKVGLGGIEGELNPLSFLNPSDIESIEVLKDVSATAIYGSRGSNGVILITTRKGKKGGSLIDYQYSFGAANSAKQLDLLNATQWARLQKDYFLNKPGYSDQEIAQLGQGYNWQKAVLQTGTTQNHALSISGGDEKSQYFLSGNYLNQEGVVLNSGFKRFVGRANYDRTLLPGLKIGVNLTGSKSTQNTLTTFEAVNYNSSPYSAGITNSLTYALYMPPVLPFYNASGGYNLNNPFEYAYLREGDTTANPIADLLKSTAQTEYSSILGNVYAQYKSEGGITAKVSVGSNLGYTTQHYFSPSYTALGLEPQGVGGIGNKKTEILLSEFTLSYAKRINDKHTFDALAGYTFQHTRNNFITTLSSSFTNEDLGVNNLQDGKPYGSRPIFSGATQSRLHSLLGRVNYSLLDRYHLTANFRSDYSTRFAKNHKWGIFPSLGLAWNINEESFLKDFQQLSNLKLRLSAGQVGNQEIGDYEYLQLLEAVYYGGNVAYSVGNNGNENLKWETTAQYNIGVDAGFLNNRISATVDVYHKKTSDLLIRIPPNLGQSNEQLVNVGNLENKGVELSVNALVIDKKRIQWSVAANVAHNTNKITRLYNNLTERILGVEILRVGEPLGSFYGQVFDGIIQKGEDVSKLPTSPSYTIPQPGDPKLRDVNRDGHIDQNDRVVLGSKQPNLIYGFSSSVNAYGFDLFVLLQGTSGNSVYNQLRRYLERPNDAYNASSALLNAWTEANPSNTVPRITSAPFSSELDSRYVEDASFLRIRTITLGYTVDKAWLASRKLPSLRVRLFATAQNPVTLTRYKGYNPEVATGIDLGTYPMPRTFLFGVNISY